MGVEKDLLQHLYDVFVSGSKTVAGPTPSQLNPHFTPNQKLLQAAGAYVDAWLLPPQPGIDKSRAQTLATEVFTIQQAQGHGVIGPPHPTQVGPIETLTPSHAQLWHAGAASLLVAALEASDAALSSLARSWWRGEAALCHLTARPAPGGVEGGLERNYQVIAPGARGGWRTPPTGTSDASPAPENAARDLDYELLLTGSLQVDRAKLQDRYFLAPWLLTGLTAAQLAPLRQPGTGTPLQGPAGGPWTIDDVPLLPSTLFVRRAGDQHAAWFTELTALDPQFQAGVDANGPWYKFWDDANPPLPKGGPSPFPEPTTPAAPVQQYGTPSGG